MRLVMPEKTALDQELDRLTEEVRPQARAEAWKAFQKAPHALELEELTAIALTGLAQGRARWRTYCAEKGHDPNATHYYVAYVLRRMRGAILDAMRSNDWVTRSARNKVKLLREAGAETGTGEAELAIATGLTKEEIREAAAAVAARPVSIDAEPHDVTDITVDVEGAAVVSGVLDAAGAVIWQLPELSRWMLVYRYYEGMSLSAAASALGVEQAEARTAWERAVREVHNAMLKAVA